VKGGNGLRECLNKMANRPDAIKFRAIMCGYKVFCEFEGSLHLLTKVKERTSGNSGYLDPVEK
jgi:hypothetical protein